MSAPRRKAAATVCPVWQAPGITPDLTPGAFCRYVAGRGDQPSAPAVGEKILRGGGYIPPPLRLRLPARGGDRGGPARPLRLRPWGGEREGGGSVRPGDQRREAPSAPGERVARRRSGAWPIPARRRSSSPGVTATTPGKSPSPGAGAGRPN